MSISSPTRIDDRLREIARDAVGSKGITDAAGDPSLAKLRALGTELWLDTGNLEEARSLWHREFGALTTNNTLANQVVQSGVMDDVVRETVRDLIDADPNISEDVMVMELGFVVNCHIALRLVKAFGAMVSVELHPDVSEDIERTVYYAERYFAICPERFYIKIPLTPEGYCAVARARAKDIPVNYTLGFSARQNYLAAVISNPTYCNVFLGRLNQVVSENRLGDGKYVGEKAAQATQMAILDLRSLGKTQTRMIAASMRSGQQVIDLAGADVFTMPPKAAKEFLDAKVDPATLSSLTGRRFDVTLLPGIDPRIIDVLWNVDNNVKALAGDLAGRKAINLTGNDLREADRDHKSGLFRRYTVADRQDIQTQGKIPDLDRWKNEPGIALDNLMTESALQSFAKDQAALDDHLRSITRSR